MNSELILLNNSGGVVCFLWLPAEVMERYHIFMKLFSVAFHMNTYITELMCAINHEIAMWRDFL